MALNATTLKNDLKPEIEAKIRSLVLGGDAAPYPNLTAFADALAQAIATKVVAHIVANAQLNNATLSNGTVTRTPSDSATYEVQTLAVSGGIL